MSDEELCIGPYRVLGTIGRGGMGVVYRAEHIATRTRVAVKTVRVPNVAMLAGIRREIHALARLRHPGVVRVVDEGLHDGLPWYAMEFLDGVTLREYSLGAQAGTTAPAPSTLDADATVDWDPSGSPLRFQRAPSPSPSESTRRPLEDLLSVIRRLCAVLSFVHGEGIVHRDIKPDNIVVLADGRPVLVDFGIVSRISGGSNREVLDLTADVAGTVAYMAPEQARGEQVDARADLYALGTILYELATGRPPFRGSSQMALMIAHQTATPVPPSKIDPSLPEALDDLILRLLAKQPEHRLGFADDVAARLESLGARNGDDGPRPRSYLYRPRLAGRDELFRQLAERYRPNRLHAAHIVFIAGESGVGKTRLMREVGQRVGASGVRVLVGECAAGGVRQGDGDRAGASPLEAFRRPLEAIVDRCRELGSAETERIFGDRGRVLLPFEPRLAEFSAVMDYPEPDELPADAARERIFRALQATFTAVTGDAPLLLIVDDLQWADELTLAFLQFLVRRDVLGSLRFGLYGTFRRDEAPDALSVTASADGVVLMNLERLAPEDVTEIVSDMLAMGAPPARLTEFLSRRSEGNPFFVAEFLRVAVDEGIIRRDHAGTWRVDGGSRDLGGLSDLDRMRVPSSLSELVARRLEWLSDDMASVVAAAAVVARDVSIDVLGTVSGLSDTALMEAVGELIRRYVIEEQSSGLLRFVHDRIREVAYSGIEPADRAVLHRRAAEALTFAADDDEIVGVLGYHWEQAGEPGLARICYLAGARSARSNYALAEAERLYRAFDGLVTTPDPECVEALNELGFDVLRIAGKASESIAVQERALRYARSIGDRDGEARSLRCLGVVVKDMGEIEMAEAHQRRALDIACADGDRRTEGVVRGFLAGLAYERGALDEAFALYSEALEIAREIDDQRGEGRTLTNLGILHVEMGRWGEAREVYDWAIKLQTEIGERPGLLTTLGNLAYLCAEQGMFDEATAQYEQALQIAREIGYRKFEAINRSNMADMLRDCGDFVRAREECERALAIHEEIGNLRWVGITLESLGTIAEAQGAVEEARAHFARALDIHERLKARRYVGSTLVCLAALERRHGDVQRAAALLEQAKPVLDEFGDPKLVLSCLCETGQVDIARGADPSSIVERVHEIASGLVYSPGSRLATEIAQLEAAVADRIR